jgi:hypothetical protein
LRREPHQNPGFFRLLATVNVHIKRRPSPKHALPNSKLQTRYFNIPDISTFQGRRPGAEHVVMLRQEIALDVRIATDQGIPDLYFPPKAETDLAVT